MNDHAAWLYLCLLAIGCAGSGFGCYRLGYRHGTETVLVATMRESVLEALSRKLPAHTKPNAITADAIATALETSRNATVYHDTNSTGPLVATWTLERKH